MKIYLYFSEEVDKSLCESIYNRIKTQRGPIEYIWLEEPTKDEQANDRGEDPEALGVFTWVELFNRCETYRKEERINEKKKRINEKEERIKDEDVVVLFTDHKNEMNYFSAWDLTGRLNFFVQTSDWELFIESDPSYPIIYELASIPLAIAAFDNMQAAEKWGHQKARGCVFDYCREKEDVKLRLRTADICSDCRQLLIDREIDPAMARQIFETFDSIRTQMLFRTRFKITETPSYIEIDKRKRTLSFLDMGQLSFRLSPQELAMYLFYLQHPEGVSHPGMESHYNEMLSIYGSVSVRLNEKDEKKDENNTILAQIENTVRGMVNSWEHDRKQDIISNIRGKFEKHIGEEMAKQYIIQAIGGNKYGLTLDRKYILMKQD